MGKRTIVEVFDDLDGSAIENDSPTIRFAVDGRGYEIDLSRTNADAFHAALEPYIKAARQVSTASARRGATGRARARDLAAVREWARANGHDVSERGRVPAAVLSAYDAAH